MSCTTYPKVTTELATQWRDTAFKIREEHAHDFNDPCRSQSPCTLCYLATAVVALADARTGRLKISGAPGFDEFKMSEEESQRLEDELRAYVAYVRRKEGLE